MINRLTLVLLVLALLVGRAASASEQSELLYSRGLVEFHGARYTEALQLFDQAVQKDAQDVYALYYRGVTQGRLGNFSAAAKDLRAVAAARADLEQVPLELGYALLQIGEYAEAAQWLERAQHSPALEAEASLFLGLAHVRLRHNEQALQELQRAATRDPALRSSAQYYEGVAYYQQRDWPRATQNFEAVVQAQPDSEIGRQAAAFLEIIRRGDAAVTNFYAESGFQYDSNVVLAPSDEAVKSSFGISRQQDGRFIISLGGRFVPWRTDRAQLSLGYEFYQSLHFQLTDFNLQDHRPNAELVVNFDRVRLGIVGRYDYYFLSTNSFLQEAVAEPWVDVPEGGFGRTEIFYRMRRRDFLARPFSGLRDAFNHAAGIRQFVYLGSESRYLLGGYQFDREDPINRQGNPFAYDGHEIDAGIGGLLPADTTAELTYAYRHERYARQSNGRRDEEHRLIVSAEKRLSEHFSLILAYFGKLNKSNDPDFDYDRNIVSLTLAVRF